MWVKGSVVFSAFFRLAGDFGAADDAVGEVQHAHAAAGEVEFGSRFGEVAEGFDDKSAQGVRPVQRQFQAEFTV